jgi:hypothetical protein
VAITVVRLMRNRSNCAMESHHFMGLPVEVRVTAWRVRSLHSSVLREGAQN